MKTISTLFQKRLIVILVTLLSATVYSQTKHIVSVTNNKFTPKDLTIFVGDTVEWRNTQGSHNVNGSTSTYPSNPESFGNSVGSNWTYSHVFKISGDYDYRCDPHFAFGMVGTITVNSVTSSNYELIGNFTKIYPNPAFEKVLIEPLSFTSTELQIKIHDITGKIVYTETSITKERIEINISQLTNGIYFIELNDNDKREMHKLIKN